VTKSKPPLGSAWLGTWLWELWAMPGKDQWASKSLRSGFGHQCTSTKPSSPGFGFGSSSRDAFQAQYSRWVYSQRQSKNWPVQTPSPCGVALRAAGLFQPEMLWCDWVPVSWTACSAEVDKAKVRSQGGDNPLGAAYNVPVSGRPWW